MAKYIGYVYFDHLDKFVVCYGKKYYNDLSSSWLFDILHIKTVPLDNLQAHLNKLNELYVIKWYSNALEGSLMAKWLKDMGVNRYISEYSLEFCHQNLIAGIGSQCVGVSLSLQKYLLDNLKTSIQDESIQYPPAIVAVGILVTLSLKSQSFFT